MPVPSKQEFIKNLRAAKIADESKLRKVIDEHQDDDVKAFALKCVGEKLITHWQAKFILSGRTKLRLGNFVLEKRIRQDELGDRFEARHESLNRKVQIQVLPPSITGSPEIRDPFIRSIGVITELDHPNISHVHDIDQQGGRYFLVDEHLDGVALAETVLSGKSLIRCLNQMLSALKETHSQNLVHGEISESCIIELENGDFKIRGFGLSLLRRQINLEPQPSMDEDVRQLATLMNERFGLLPVDQQSEFAWLRTELESLGSNPNDSISKVIAKTDGEIATWVEAEAPVIAVVEEPIAPANVLPPIDHVKQTKPAAKSSFKKQAETSTADADAEEVPKRRKKSIPWFAHPIGIAGIGIGTLAIAGLILWIGGAFDSGQKPKVADNEKDFNVPAKTNTNNDAKQENTNNDPGTNEEKKQRDPVLNQKLDKSDVAADVEKLRNRMEAENKQNQNKPNPPNNQVANNNPNQAANNKPPKPQTETNQKPDQETPGGNGNNQANQVAEMPKNDGKGGGNAATTTKMETAPKVSAVFARLDDRIELPDANLPAAITIGEIESEGDSIDLELICDSNCFPKGKGWIQLFSTEDNRWVLTYLSKKEATKGVEFGSFTFSKPELTFQWKEGTNKASPGNYLRNCILKVKADDQVKEILLRDESLIDTISLTEAQYEQAAKTKIAWLPKAESIQVTVYNPGEPWPTTYGADNAKFTSHQFDEKFTPLGLTFSPDDIHKNLGVFIQPKLVGAKASSRIDLGVSVVARFVIVPPDNQPVTDEKLLLAKHATIVERFEQLHQMKNDLVEEQNNANRQIGIEQQLQRGQVTKAREYLSSVNKSLDVVKKHWDTATEIRDRVSELHDIEIPVKVEYILGDRRILLAQTSALPAPTVPEEKK